MSDFQVYGWGRGEHGRLGFGDNDKSSKMVPQRVQLLAGQNIVQVVLITYSKFLSDWFSWIKGLLKGLSLMRMLVQINGLMTVIA